MGPAGKNSTATSVKQTDTVEEKKEEKTRREKRHQQQQQRPCLVAFTCKRKKILRENLANLKY